MALRQSRVELMTLQTIDRNVRTSQDLELDRLITNSENKVTEINPLRFLLCLIILFSLAVVELFL